MPEDNDRPPQYTSLEKLKRNMETLERNTYEKVREIRMNLDTDSKFVREELGALAPALGFLSDPNNLPKILQVTAGDKEYVSIRRVEAPEISRSFTRVEKPLGGDAFDTQFVAQIPIEFIEEGQILVFDRPDTVNLKCKKPEVEEKVRESLGEKIEDYAGLTYLATVSECPDLFDKDEWEPYSMSITLITKRNGKFYRGDLSYFRNTDGEWSTSLGQLSKLRPTKDKKVEFEYAGYFQNQIDLEANQDYFKKWGRMYVLTEGSSEKEQQRQADKKLTELKTTSPITT